jgi:ferredoxin
MIIIDRELCLNSRYKMMECQLCRRKCPVGCIDDTLAVDAGNCNDCGLCLSSCPAEAIASTRHTPKVFENMLTAADSPVVLSCRQEHQKGWPCLGFLDSRLLLALVCSGKHDDRQVVVDDRACADCKPGVASYLTELLAAVNCLLAAAGKSPVISGEASGGISCRQKTMSRRSFFTAILGEAVDTVRSVTTSDGYGERLHRQALFEQYAGGFRVDGPLPPQLFSGIAISDACNSCGLCVKLCPNKAINIVDHGEVCDFHHKPQNCTGCGVCVVHCPQTALSLAAAPSSEEYHVATRALPRCAACGSLYQPIGNQQVCLECLLKGRPILTL